MKLEVATELREKGISAIYYHTEMDANAREKVHMRWNSGKLQVIVGTVAFGMGINKPDAAVWRPRQPPPPEKVSDDSADDDSKTKAASQADLDNSGTIDYTEFVAAMLHLNKAQKEDHMFAAFIYFDKDGSGYITSDELQHACKQFGLEGGQLEGIMHEVDKDNDGHIDYSEFVAMMQDTGLDRGFQNLKSIGLRNTYGW